MLVHLKDQTPLKHRAGMIYEAPCGDYLKVYIGQTGRTLSQRLKEHRRALTSRNLSQSAMEEHAAAHDHATNWGSAKVVDKWQDSTTLSMQVGTGDNHYTHKWGISISDCMKTHHQHKLQPVTTTTCASGVLAPLEKRETPQALGTDQETRCKVICWMVYIPTMYLN